jgi:hypothetical protein
LPAKPFNPLLGETFEFVKPGKYKFFAEQVSHHPPITAYVCLGDNGSFKREVVHRARSNISMGSL